LSMYIDVRGDISPFPLWKTAYLADH